MFKIYKLMYWKSFPSIILNAISIEFHGKLNYFKILHKNSIILINSTFFTGILLF